MLDAEQLATLAELAIPVWELRGDPQDNTEINEQLLHAKYLVLVNQQHYQQPAQCLLSAMLKAVNINGQQLLLLKPEDIADLAKLPPSAQQILLVFGEQQARLLVATPLARGKIHRILNSQLATIISDDLNDLLADPLKKALAWQDLKLIEQVAPD